jgi:signal transduction histidine kinase
MDGEELLKERFVRFSANQRLVRSKVTCSVAAFFVLFGGALDYLVYPGNFQHLLIIRVGCVTLLGVIYFARLKFGKNQDIWFYIETVWPIVINAAICLMVATQDGAASTYYAGLNATILGAMLLFYLTFRSALIITIASIMLYLWAILPTASMVPQEVIINNLYFIFLTGIVSCIASFLNEESRFREFSLSYELDKRNHELADMDRVKSEFFANISHELRTPLTLILSPVEDLLNSNQPFDMKVKRSLTTVRDNGFRLLKLVNDLLSIIRLDEGAENIKRGLVEINPLLRNVVNSMGYIAQKQGIELKVDLAIGSRSIVGDVSSFEKIFINLLNNAIKFTKSEGAITVSTELNEGDIVISFADTGIGISEENLPIIFDRFKQADSSVTRKYQGTGLGLALVKELTLAHEGEIDAKSTLGVGTVISLRFPLASEVETKAIQPVSEELSVEVEDNALQAIHKAADYSVQLNISDSQLIEPNSFQNDDVISETDSRYKPSVLIVDDEPDLRSYLVNTFSDTYKVMSAADGELGLAMAKKHTPDLIILDLMLPKMDGLQVCAAITSDEQLKFSKVMLLTARIDENSKLTALTNGADDFLTKPFSTIEVKTRLANLWESAQLERGLKRQNTQLEKALIDLKALESKLIHSEKINAIGSMASGLLHEVNNPLNYAIIAMQMMKREPDVVNNENLKELTQDAFEGMERISSIVKDLHAFAHPSEADKEEQFSVRKAVENAMRFTAGDTKRINIENTVEDAVCLVGSYNHVVQVLVNLIMNASKATALVTRPSIVISTKEITKKTGSELEQRIQIIVRDNGSGIEKTAISRIFEPFYTTREVGEGLGMGLSICHTIINNHGGELEVSSELNEFAEFRFDLPLSIN